MPFDPKSDVLIFEGAWDAHAFKRILDHAGRTVPEPRPIYKKPMAGLVAASGWPGALDRFDSDVSLEHVRRIALVLDNDDAGKPAAGASALLADQQVAVTLPVSGGFGPALTSSGKLVGAYFLPDNANQGAVEDFLSSLVSPSDPLFSFAARATSDALSHTADIQPYEHLKAQFRAFLAWHHPPGGTYADAMNPAPQPPRPARFDLDAPRARDFVTWFDRMFP